MKPHFLLFPLLALAPATTFAQGKPAPQIKTEPAVNVLLDRATATYKNASGIRYRALNSFNAKNISTITVAFSRPNLLSIETQYRKATRRKLYDGANFYTVSDDTYRKDVSPSATALPLLMGYGENSGQLIGAMLDGKNPIELLQNLHSDGTFFQNYKGNTIFLGPRVVDGDVLSGIQNTCSYSFEMPESPGKTVRVSEQLTAWFGGTPLLLRRVQLRGTVDNGKIYTRSEKITDQQLSPTFEEGTFKWNDTGLKLAVEKSDNDIYWDPRLKVAAQPFAFSAKTLSGATITPAKYKGKVLLLDFWATWCGPCVEGLPELQATYNKHHAQGLEVVGISSDQDKDALASFIKARKMAWPQIFDKADEKASVSNLYGVKGIPFLLLIGRNGKIAAVNPRDDLEGAVKRALAAS